MNATNDNPQLVEIANLDQDDRVNWNKVEESSIEEGELFGKEVRKRDVLRRELVKEILKSGGIRTALDHHNAALVMHHGKDPKDYMLAYSLATLSWHLNPEVKVYRWLAAAAWDRLLIWFKCPQWYGTQFTDGPVCELIDIDRSKITAEEREFMGVTSLQESEKWAKNET